MLMHKKPNIPLMVYLDQNKWIDLGLAYHQHQRGTRFATTLEKVRNAVRQNIAKLPFSSVHVMETMKAGDTLRRYRLAQVIAEFSQGWAVAPQDKITSLEFNMAMASIFNRPIAIISPVVFGQGIEFAFGEPVHAPIFLRLLNSHDEKLREKGIEALTFFLSSPLESLRRPGIDKFNASMNTNAAQADQIRNLVRNRDKDTRHRAYTARQVIDDLNYRRDDFIALLLQMRLTYDDFTNLGREGLTKLYENVPTIDVMMKLKIQRNDQFEKVITPNDLNDLSFLSVAIPYCDIVVTEKQWVDLIKRKKLDEKYKTVLLSDLEELKSYL